MNGTRRTGRLNLTRAKFRVGLELDTTKRPLMRYRIDEIRSMEADG